MKKGVVELKQKLIDTFNDDFPMAFPQGHHSEIVALLPEYQLEVRSILSHLIKDKRLDLWLRYAAACYMLEYFAPPFFNKETLFRALWLLSAVRSRRVKAFEKKLLPAIKRVSRQQGFPVNVTKTLSPLESLLEEIAHLSFWNSDAIKWWSWEIPNKKITCSIGKEKIF